MEKNYYYLSENNNVNVIKQSSAMGKRIEVMELYDLGLSYSSGDTESKKMAVKYLRKAANQGHAMAQYMMGYFYQNGEGVKKDPVKAVKWFQKAAEQNMPGGLFVLASCYDFGDGVKQNKAKAIEYYIKAAELGDVGAIENLESMICKE